MASTKQYLAYVLYSLSGLEEIIYKPMMGEYLLYFRGKLFGGIYDDRLLIKPVKSASLYLPSLKFEAPYKGAKEMLLIDELDNRELLEAMILAAYEELPFPKTKK